jgi:hypothetical protein
MGPQKTTTTTTTTTPTTTTTTTTSSFIPLLDGEFVSTADGWMANSNNNNNNKIEYIPLTW